MNTHTHHSHHDHNHSRAFGFGIALNALFVAAEIAYGLKANSLALLADAGHNASDVLGLCLAWGAAMLAKREASERFTYGLQSLSIFASLANALLLLVAIGGIGWEALERFATPQAPMAEIVMIVAAMGVAVNGVTAWMFHGDHHHDLNIRAAFVHMAGDAAISLGVVISGLVFMKTGWLWLDTMVSLAIVIAIVLSSWGLLKRSATLAMHAVPDDIDPAQVRNFLLELPGVSEVHDLHIWAMSTTGVALSAHLLMQGGHPGDGFLRQTTHALEHRFHIHHATLQIEIGDAGEECHTDCGHEH